MNVEIVYFE